MACSARHRKSPAPKIWPRRARPHREIGEKWYRVWQAYQNDVIEAHKTDDLSESQPTKGNIAGGLTTIEEKALGNLEKIGRECRYIDVLETCPSADQRSGTLFHGQRHRRLRNASR